MTVLLTNPLTGPIAICIYRYWTGWEWEVVEVVGGRRSRVLASGKARTQEAARRAARAAKAEVAK